MNLTELRIHKFKAFEQATITPAGLTVLIGGNNAGKSTVLHAMALVGQSALDNRFTSNGSLVDLGPDMNALTHTSGAPTRRQEPSGWRIDWKWHTTSEVANLPPVPLDVSYTLRLEPATVAWEFAVALEVPKGRIVHVRFNSWPTMSLQVIAEAGKSSLGELQPFQSDGPLTGVGPFGVTTSASLPSTIANADLEQGVPGPTTNFALAIAAPYLGRFVQEALQSFRYVGANRHVESSVFALGTQSHVNPRTAQELVDTLAYSADLLKRVSRRSHSIFGYGIETELLPNRQVALAAVGDDTRRRNIVNMGTGLIQLVWIVTQLELSASAPHLNPALQPVVGIEEPELHLHPGLQPHAARVLAEFVKSGLQVVCTSQSDHFLMSVLELVLDGTLSADQLAVYHIANNKAERMEVDQKGQLQGGLKGFFEENEDQLKRHIELLKRGV
jgi:hypothetical protein